MKIKFNLYLLFLRLFLSFIFFLIISLFFSKQKILIVFFISIIFCLSKINYQKIILINLIILVFFLKLAMYPFQQKTADINPSKITIYEKHFLYGLRNLDFTLDIYNGDLSSLNKTLEKKYIKKKPKRINIITDKLGFRNETKLNNADYILIGDSILYSANITQKKILNYILQDEFNIKTYNAGLAITDISHYMETIKFFKENMKLKNKKYVMFIFQGNDFLNYNTNDNNSYHKYINNNILHSYFKFKVFFNFYHTLKYYSHALKKNKNEFKKVYEYEVNGNEILFKFDYIYSDDYKVSSLNNIFKKYEKYLPDLVIFIPTKYEVYCNLIKNNNCNNSNHFSILKNDTTLSNVKILNTTNNFQKNAKNFLKEKNQLLYEIDDTHLNEIGINVLAKFISDYLSNNSL